MQVKNLINNIHFSCFKATKWSNLMVLLYEGCTDVPHSTVHGLYSLKSWLFCFWTDVFSTDPLSFSTLYTEIWVLMNHIPDVLSKYMRDVDIKGPYVMDTCKSVGCASHRLQRCSSAVGTRTPQSHYVPELPPLLLMAY